MMTRTHQEGLSSGVAGDFIPERVEARRLHTVCALVKDRRLRMRKIGAVGAVVALASLLGCASAGPSDPGSSTAGLTWVRKADFENQILYYDSNVSAAPLTAEAMGDLTWATP